MLEPGLKKLMEKLSVIEAEVANQENIAQNARSAAFLNSVRAARNGDTGRKKYDSARMNDITREEFNAKLETIEVKMDARVESISSKIEGFLSAQAERDKRLDESLAGMRRDIDKLGSLKLNIWGAMLTAVGLGVAITALSVSFYQTGKAERPEISQPPAVTAPPAPKQLHN